MKSSAALLKIIAILWVIWGLVHIMAGVITMNFITSADIPGAVGGIADGTDPTLIQMPHSEASGAIIGQHGFNLAWIGIVTFICGFFIWKKNRTAVWLAALVGGLADLGYFIFMDLGGFVNFMPGTVMTLVSGSAILLSAYVYFKAPAKG